MTHQLRQVTSWKIGCKRQGLKPQIANKPQPIGLLPRCLRAASPPYNQCHSHRQRCHCRRQNYHRRYRSMQAAKLLNHPIIPSSAATSVSCRRQPPPCRVAPPLCPQCHRQPPHCSLRNFFKNVIDVDHKSVNYSLTLFLYVIVVNAIILFFEILIVYYF